MNRHSVEVAVEIEAFIRLPPDLRHVYGLMALWPYGRETGTLRSTGKSRTDSTQVNCDNLRWEQREKHRDTCKTKLVVCHQVVNQARAEASLPATGQNASCPMSVLSVTCATAGISPYSSAAGSRQNTQCVFMMVWEAGSIWWLLLWF